MGRREWLSRSASGHSLGEWAAHSPGSLAGPGLYASTAAVKLVGSLHTAPFAFRTATLQTPLHSDDSSSSSRSGVPTRRRGDSNTAHWHGAGLPGPMEAQKKPHSQPPPSWSALPLDLARLVLRLLPAYADRARFAAVCPQWRAATRQQLLPPPLPLLALPNGTFYRLPDAESFRFPGCGFAGYKSACGNWLIFPRDDGCFLVDPFSRATVTLPALSCVRLRPPNAVAKWSSQHGTRITDPYVTWMHMDSDKLHIKKLILCSSNLVAALVGVGPVSQILICQPGALSWSVRAYDECKGYEDMAFYQGKLYAIADDERLLVVNISEDNKTGDPQVSKIGRVIKDKADSSWCQGVYEDNSMTHKKLYLVESRGALLMVRRKIWLRVSEPGTGAKVIAGPSEFEVFEADFELSRWIKLSTVGDDQVLFLGRRCSRAVSVSQYGLLGNRIFFLDDDDECLVNYFYGEENTSCSAYDMRLGDVSSPHPMISWKRRRGTRLAAWLFPED